MSGSYHMERHIHTDTPAVKTSGWARWQVFDQTGDLAGMIAEEREWLGHTWGPSTYTAAHNPTGEDFGALWRTEGHPTPKAAFDVLVAHLEDGGPCPG
ncbi:MAG: hypothetical protein ACRDHS_07850 [Actinomycetota bacterium]